MTGSLLIWLALFSLVVSAISYYRLATKRASSATLARRSYAIAVLSVVGASVLMMVYILQHRFEYAYVWGYSSKDLPLHLLITTFWAGQEGSFLFWTLCSVLIGLFLRSYTQRRRIEFEVMTIYSFLLSFLLILMIAKPPFQYLWEAHPKEVPIGQVPQDGRGLNPLLQNIWMIAHPPVLFIGFAAVAVPFAFALAGLWKRSYSTWIADAFPWVLFATLSLGAGIMLGGYWAYGVLGWGGWWGWDPVENSSLIPWITTLILLHTILVQKRTGNLVRTNFLLAIVSFVLVIYSTFLTRSGILGDSSVHSFTDPGAIAYSVLLIWIAAVAGLGLAMFFRRWNDLKKLAGSVGMFTRESFIAIASIAMGVSALIIFFGTSWPIVSHSTVEPSFYDRTNLPIAVILSLLLGVSLLLTWKVESRAGLFKRASFAFGASLLVTIGLILAGLDNWQMGLLAFASLFAFFVNAAKLVKVLREDARWAGGAIAHVGLAMLFLGIIGSGYYSQKITTSLTLNEPKEIFGYQVMYTGAIPIDGNKWRFHVIAERGGESYALGPVMYHSDYNNSLMREPDYVSFLTRDFYIEPVSLEQGEQHDHSVELPKGEPVTINGMKVTFLRFDMGQHGADAMTSGGAFSIGAVLEVERNGRKEQITVVTTYKDGAQPEPKPTMLKNSPIGFEMLSMRIDSETRAARIRVNVLGLEDRGAVTHKPEELIIEASLKPFMSVVWIAAVFVLGGVTLSMIRRIQETRENGKGEHRRSTLTPPSSTVTTPVKEEEKIETPAQ